jgi:DNA-binding MarR family transcriptional regulator
MIAMSKNRRTAAGAAVTDLVLDLFKVSNKMITAGDRLVSRLGLTSARWQILGAIVAAKQPQPVAWIARDLGANRQNVQRIVNDLVADGLLMLRPNPHHRRAHLVLMTGRGAQAFEEAMRLQAPWVNTLSEGIAVKDIEAAKRVLTALRARLEKSPSADSN